MEASGSPSGIRAILAIDVSGLAIGFEGEGIAGQSLVHLDVEVDAVPVFSRTFVEDLLQAHGPVGVDPNGHLGKDFANGGIFGHQFQLFGLHCRLAVG